MTNTTTQADHKLIGAPAAFGILLALLGAVGLWFSGLIMHDKITIMQDPEFVPACTLNSIVSCTDVMASPQAAAFGFANPIIGLAGFPIVVTFGVALAAKVAFPKWMWWGMTVGLGLGVVFVHWLAYQAVYNIDALCLYCMAVWAVMLPLFIMTLVRLARSSARLAGRTAGTGLVQPVVVLIAWYAGFAVIVGERFFF